MRLILPMLFLLPLCAQETPAPGGRRGMPEPKNLKILKPEQVMPAMRSFTSGLGVKCEFCHIQSDFAADDNKKKVTARQMISMTQQINTHFGAESNRVTCYTCHRGENEPKSAPPTTSGPPPGR